MSAAARPQDPSDETIRVALAELRTFEDLTRDQSRVTRNIIEIENKAGKINEELSSALTLGSAFASNKKIRNAIYDSLTAFIGAVYAYLEFEKDAPSSKSLSSASVRQRATNRKNMWIDMRKTLDKLLNELERLS